MNGEILKLDEVWQQLQSGQSVYLDIRSTGEFEGGHPQGAYHIPLIEMGPQGQAFNESFVAAVRGLVDALSQDGKAPDLVVACQAGGRSRQTCQLLAAEGITQTYDFSGGWGGRPHPFGGPGMAGWAGSDKPVSTKAEAGRNWPALKAKLLDE